MDFEKKLVILSGKTGQGTVLLERNGMGTFVTVNAFSLPDLTAGEYALGVKTGQTVFRREIGSLGRIKSRFALPEGDYTAVHFVLFRTYDEEVVLYGTSEARKMWDANVMDGLRRNGLEKKTTSDAHAAVAATAQEFRYSERKIEDYFLEIDPARYHDTAVAEVNYFDYGKRGGEPQNGYYDAPAAPSDLERQYLRARFTRPQAPAQTASVQEEAPAPAFAPEPPPAAVGVHGGRSGGGGKDRSRILRDRQAATRRFVYARRTFCAARERIAGYAVGKGGLRYGRTLLRGGTDRRRARLYRVRRAG